MKNHSQFGLHFRESQVAFTNRLALCGRELSAVQLSDTPGDDSPKGCLRIVMQLVNKAFESK
jgi:hypothetical protein